MNIVIKVIFAFCALSVLLSCSSKVMSNPSEFKVVGGVLTKDAKELQYLLKSNPGKSAIALIDLKKPYSGKVTFNLDMKTIRPGGIRNGFLLFGSGKNLIKVGVFIGGKALVAGNFSGSLHLENKKLNIEIKQDEVISIKVSVNIATKRLTLSHGAKYLESTYTGELTEITKVGYLTEKTQTEFGAITIQ
jgi:hypothetical protein